MSRQQGAIERTYAAVSDNSLSISSLRESGRRIAALKTQLAGTWDEVLSSNGALDKEEWAALKRRNAYLSQAAYEASITVVLQDGRSVLPLASSPDTTVLVFTPRMESINLAVDDADGILRDGQGRLRNTAGPSYNAFAAAISKRSTSTMDHHIVYGPDSKSEWDKEVPDDLLRSACAVIFATRNGFDKGVWQIDYLRSLVQRLKGLSASSGDPKELIVVSTCAPYDVLDLDLELEGDELSGAVISTMEFTVTALETAVKVIFGETEGKGRVPVHLS